MSSMFPKIQACNYSVCAHWHTEKSGAWDNFGHFIIHKVNLLNSKSQVFFFSYKHVRTKEDVVLIDPFLTCFFISHVDYTKIKVNTTATKYLHFLSECIKLHNVTCAMFLAPQ